MFGLTLVDHLRLTFGHIIYTHRAHARLALRHARWNRVLQVVEAILLAVTAATAFAGTRTGIAAYAIAATAAAVLALIVLAVRVIFNFEQSASAHRTCSAHLWHMREQYRALLADLRDGSISLEMARDRRDALMRRLHEIYRDAAPLDRGAFRASREALAVQIDGVMNDEEVDRFLPTALRKGGQSAA